MRIIDINGYMDRDVEREKVGKNTVNFEIKFRNSGEVTETNDSEASRTSLYYLENLD